MPRGKEGSFDTMREFLRDYLKDGEPFKASIAYAEFWKSGKAVDDLGRTISQKDFAMFLRTEVLKKDGLLKRTAHGIYEKRIDPEDHGVTFARKNPAPDISFDADDAYLDGIQVSPADARLASGGNHVVFLELRRHSRVTTLRSGRRLKMAGCLKFPCSPN